MKKIFLALAIIILTCAAPAFAFIAKPGQLNGVPLGGIGTGSLEILPDGRFANITINNNHSQSERVTFATGSLFAVNIEQNSASSSYLLQTDSQLNLAGISQDPQRLLLPQDSVTYDGLYPKMNVDYIIPDSQIKLSMTGFSPVVPGNIEASGMPAAVFSFEISNPSQSGANVSIAFSWENLNGTTKQLNRAGRYPAKLIRTGPADSISGISFGYLKKTAESYWGTYVTLVDCPADGNTGAMMWAPDTAEGFAGFWKTFANGGALSAEIDPEPEAYSGALSCRISLKPGETREIAFSLSWYFPDYFSGSSIEGVNMGNFYATQWSGAAPIAQTALAKRRDLLGAVDAWHKPILDSNLPEWLKQMLINNLYVFTTNTLHAKDGKYSIMETPGGPMMGTLDQGFYSSIATMLFFPELEKTEINLFADTQHHEDAGRIYHDLGRARFDKPSAGTTDKKWTDLNPKFALMAYRNYLWTGNREEIAKLYPKLKQVMAFTFGQDDDGDLLPDQNGRSTTYDDWAFYGANSYASGIYLASMAAYSEIAAAMNDPVESEKYGSLLPRASKSFEDKLWDDKDNFFILYNDTALPDGGDRPDIMRGSHDGQLAGQWYADFLALGKLFPQERIDSAIKYIGKLNQKEFGVAKGLMTDGSPIPNPPSENWWSESENGWPHYEICHYASLAIMNGFANAGLDSVSRVYKNIHEVNQLPWNQPLRWDLSKNEPYGWGADRYMTSPGVWHVLLALEGFNINLPLQKLWLRPQLPSDMDSLKAPLITPITWGWMDFSETISKKEYHQSLSISFDDPMTVRELFVKAPPTNLVAGVNVVLADGTPAKFNFERRPYGKLNEIVIDFDPPLSIGPVGVIIEIAGKQP
ncbi:MAG: GH116 family glycosyl-hydrolase [bacterium]